MTDTPGDRLYEVRLACGDGRRRAEPISQFVQRVERATGRKYHAATISMLERNEQKWRLEDVRAFAAVDPLNRGEAWLSALAGPATGALAVEGYALGATIMSAADRRPSHVRAAEKFGGKVAEGSRTPLSQKVEKPHDAAASAGRRKKR